MNMREHIVRRGETLESIAARYTGQTGRARELLYSNPTLMKTQGSVGQYASAFRENMRLRLPASWGMVGASPQAGDEYGFSSASTTDGQGCTPSGSGVEVKPYLYVVTADDVSQVSLIPTKFGMPVNKPSSGGTKWFWHELRAVNTDWPGGFVMQSGACVFSGLREGSTLRIPANWGKPRAGVKVVEGDEPGVDGGDKKDGLDTVRDEDEGGTPTWLWVVLGVGGAVGLGLLATGALKKKRATTAG